MAKTGRERVAGRGRGGGAGSRCAAAASGPVAAAALFLASAASAGAQTGPGFGPVVGMASSLHTIVPAAVAIGVVVAAFGVLAVITRRRGDARLLAAQAETAGLRAALDRAEAMLGADDQRTVVWDVIGAAPQVFGGLPERVGAPADKSGFVAFPAWLGAEGAVAVEEAIGRLRRNGDAFSLALRTLSGSVIEIVGRTSGRRALVRFRELTGERRSFAELKEQATFVINEMTALRALADLLPVPVWRRNRAGRLTWVNAAYARAAETAGVEAALSAGIELLPSRVREAAREAARTDEAYREIVTAVLAGERRRVEVRDRPMEDGSVGCAVDVSASETMREELDRTRQAQARLLDQLSAGVASFRRDGRLVFHNARFRDIFGLPAEQLTADIDEGAILDRLRAERKLPEQVNYREWRARHLAGYRLNQGREDLWHLADGRSLRVVALPAGDGGMTYLYENVTEQFTLQGRLQTLLQLQTETFEHLTEAVAVFGTDGRLRLFNPVFAAIWNLAPETLKSEPHVGAVIESCRALAPDPAAWEAIRIAATHLEHGREPAGRMERPDGRVVDYATVALPDGMTMVTFVDVTDTVGVQRALSEKNDALEAADRLKSMFIQHVSYELRSPLTNIIGQTELLADETFGALNDKQREYMGDIASSSAALLAIINDILDLATVDAGIMSLDLRDTDVAAVAAGAVEGLKDRLVDQAITLDLSIPADIGSFRVDESRVRQILFNLVANAIRFSNRGGSVTLAAERRDGWVVYRVSDDGIGIPADILPNVTDPFEAHGSRGRRSGAGLGLAIVRRFVELHGGSLEIASIEGEGTEATVRLPAAPQVASAAPAERAEAAA